MNAEPFFPNPLESIFVTTTTTCNLQCVFCAYSKSSIPKRVMPLEDFKAYIKKALRFGFDTFNLTPLLGEPLTDPLFIERLIFLDQHVEVNDFYFSTNLTLADDGFFKTLSSLKKLRWLSISVYGHDQPSFLDITQTTKKLYERLLESLRRLAQHKDLFSVTEIKIRTQKSFDLDSHQSELCAILRHLRDNGIRVRSPKMFSNWGGMIEAAELEKRAMLQKPITHPKTSPCVFLFYKPVILPDGKVNACSAGDGNTRFIIGDLKKDDFREILSSPNPRYMNLLQSHIRGEFNDPCTHCTAYRSPDQFTHSYQYHRKPRISLSQFMHRLTG